VTGFLILAAVLVAGALLLVVPPMLGAGARTRALTQRQKQAETALLVLREQLAELKSEHVAGRIDEQAWQRASAELEARALEEGRAAEDGADTRPARSAALIVALLVPLVAGGFYLSLGEPAGLDPDRIAGTGDDHQITPEQMAGLVAQLVDRLDADPSDPTGWIMLVRSFGMLNDIDGAVKAWQRIGHKIPDEPTALSDWADMLAVSQDGDFSGDPARLVSRALEIDPTHIKALALAGTAAFEQGDFATAVSRWEAILAQIPPQEEAYASVLESVNQARSRGGMALLPAPDQSAAASAEVQGSALTLSGTLSLAPELLERASAEDVVFVFMRGAGGGMPIAALRFTVADLPVAFDFSRAQRMSSDPVPDQVQVAARVALGGGPSAQSGDLESSLLTLSPNERDVALVIDRVRD